VTDVRIIVSCNFIIRNPETTNDDNVIKIPVVFMLVCEGDKKIENGRNNENVL
jgi:hypothetical protein